MGLRPPAVTSVQTLVAAYLHLANASRLDLERHAGRYLAERLGVNPMAASRILAQLREAGLVAPAAPGSRAATPVVPVEAFGFRFVEATVGQLPETLGDEVVRPVKVVVLLKSPEKGKSLNPEVNEGVPNFPENGENGSRTQEKGAEPPNSPERQELPPKLPLDPPGNKGVLQPFLGGFEKNHCNREHTTPVKPSVCAGEKVCYKLAPLLIRTDSLKDLLVTGLGCNTKKTTDPIPSISERKKQAVQAIVDMLVDKKRYRGRPPTRKALTLAGLYIKRRKKIQWDYEPDPKFLLPQMTKAVRLLESVGEGPRQWGCYLDWLFANAGKWTRGQLQLPPVSWVASASRVDAWSARTDRERHLSAKTIMKLIEQWWPDPKEAYTAMGVIGYQLQKDLGTGVPGIFPEEPFRTAYRYVWEHRQEVIDGGK